MMLFAVRLRPWDENLRSAPMAARQSLNTFVRQLELWWGFPTLDGKILANLSQTFTDNGVNIAQANCKVTEPDRAVSTFEILIKDLDQLNRVLGQIRKIHGVLGADRI
jgi:hypothetical protein